jgi:hypothetical protein
MRGRLHRRIEALRDGALPPRRARLVRERLESDPEAARILRRTEALGRAIHEAWTEGPPGPDPEALVERLRPGLARIDRELAEEGTGRRLLDRVVAWLVGARGPVLATGAFAAALALLVFLSTFLPVIPPSGVARAEETTVVRSLRQQGNSVFVLEGEDGATIIWVLDEGNPDTSSRTYLVDGWA